MDAGSAEREIGGVKRAAGDVGIEPQRQAGALLEDPVAMTGAGTEKDRKGRFLRWGLFGALPITGAFPATGLKAARAARFTHGSRVGGNGREGKITLAKTPR